MPSQSTDPFASIATPIQTAAPSTSAPANGSDPFASIATPISQTAKHADTLNGPNALASWDKPKAAPIAPPQDHKEELVRSLSGDVGLGVYRQARDTVGKVENLVKSPSGMYDAAKQEIQQLGANAKANLTPEAYDLDPAHHPQGIYAQPVPPPATLPGVGAVRGTLATAAAMPEEAASTTARVVSNNPFRRMIQNATATPIERGESASQPAAQQAIRQGAQTAATSGGTADESLVANTQNQPLLGRNQTVIDEHLSALRGQEADAYERMDDAAGFDVKAEKLQLKNDQYKLQQLGNTDADIAAREKLTSSIADSKQRIAAANKAMADANVDPNEADVLHTKRMAGVDVRKALIQNISSDGQTVNVNGLLNTAKKLQFTKYGNRLEQFFGSPEAANTFLTGLEEAQKVGVAAKNARQLRNLVLGALEVGGVTGTLGDIAYHATK